jgi:hypothetical protein
LSLIRCLKGWKQKNPEIKLIIMFHEIYATGPWYSSVFWLTGIQRWLARELLLMCDHAITNCEKFKDILQNWCPQKDIVCSGVFSNMGEPDCCVKNEPPFAVVFGNKAVRENVYNLLDHWEDDLFRHGVREIVDIGKYHNHVPHIGPFKFRQLGFMERQAVSDLMSSAQIGLLYYPKDYLGKSGIFAAYLAHRVIPVNLHPSVMMEFSVIQQLQTGSVGCGEAYKTRCLAHNGELFLSRLAQQNIKF